MSGLGKKKARLVAERRYAKSKPARKRVKKPARKTSSSKPHASLFGRLFGWVFRSIWLITSRVTAVVAIILGLGVLYYYSTLPSASALVDGRARGSVTLLDRNGEVFAWRGDQFGGMVTAETVSKHLKNAVIATEDKRFYKHLGISPRGIASAVKINLSEGRGPLSGHGGSTISQQTAKLLCLGEPFDPAAGKTETEYETDCRRNSMWRKITEMTYALALEAKYTKDEILTIYLNRAFLGAGARGFEAASLRYFGKSAAEVSPAEAAMLAGLLVAPTRYAPTNDLTRAQNRAGVIIGLMEAQGYLSASAATEAKTNPAQLSTAAQARTGGYFADWIMGSGPDFFTRQTTEDVIIRSTFDPKMQTAAEEALAQVFATKVSEGSKAQAAIVVMSPDGAVRAMVGGRKTKVSGAFNRATQALRQTGSAFKPFVYAAALELDYKHNDFVNDSPLTIDVPVSGPWSPKNYDNTYRGRITLVEALKHSVNTAAVRISEGLGRDRVRQIAEDFGVKSTIADLPSIALGASESTLIEMTGAYAGILNGGSAVIPYGLVELKFQGEDELLMVSQGGIGERVIRPEASAELIYMMYEVVEGGTGTRARISGREIAGKTGTTQAARDAWFIGFSADYVAGVWMGYDDNTPLRGVTGGGLPAEIFRETMIRVHDGLALDPLPMARPTPEPVAIVPVEPATPQATTLERSPERKKNADKVFNAVLEAILGKD